MIALQICMILIAKLAANRDARANKKLVRPVVAVTLSSVRFPGCSATVWGGSLDPPKLRDK